MEHTIRYINTILDDIRSLFTIIDFDISYSGTLNHYRRMNKGNNQLSFDVKKNRLRINFYVDKNYLDVIEKFLSEKYSLRLTSNGSYVNRKNIQMNTYMITLNGNNIKKAKHIVNDFYELM